MNSYRNVHSPPQKINKFFTSIFVFQIQSFLFFYHSRSKISYIENESGNIPLMLWDYSMIELCQSNIINEYVSYRYVNKFLLLLDDVDDELLGSHCLFLCCTK